MYNHVKMSNSVIIMIIIPQKISEDKISFYEKMGLAGSLESYRQALAWSISVEEPTYLKNNLIRDMVVHCYYPVTDFIYFHFEKQMRINVANFFIKNIVL